MTRADLYDHCVAYGCTLEKLSETTSGYAIKVINPSLKSYWYMDLPVDEKPVKPFTVCKCCVTLGIPIPDESKHLVELHEEIKKKHHPDL